MGEKRSVQLTFTVSVDELVPMVAYQMGQSEVLRLIKEIDSLVADWDFTLDLYRHFAKCKKDYDREYKD